MSGRVWNIWSGIVYMGEMRGRFMEQMVWNREWGGVRGRVWNRWCRIVSGVRCEVVYVTGGVESCMGVGCEVVYGTDGVESCIWDEMRGRVWARWCQIVYGVRCEVGYGTGGVKSCMGWDAMSCMEYMVSNRV